MNVFAVQTKDRNGFPNLKRGMKKTLDKYISEHYDEVRKYTNHFLKAYNKRKNITLSMLNADTCINNAYLHVLTIDTDKIDTNSVKSYLLNTIKYQIIWDTSLSHKQDDCLALEFIPKDEPDNDDVKHKIGIENKYNDQLAYIEIYRNSLTCPVEKKVFESYYDKGHRTAKSLGKYFGISNTSAHYLIRGIKLKIREIQYSYENK